MNAQQINLPRSTSADRASRMLLALASLMRFRERPVSLAEPESSAGASNRHLPKPRCAK